MSTEKLGAGKKPCWCRRLRYFSGSCSLHKYNNIIHKYNNNIIFCIILRGDFLIWVKTIAEQDAECILSGIEML